MIAVPASPDAPLSLRFGRRGSDVVYAMPGGMAVAAAAGLAWKHWTDEVHVPALLAAWAVAWGLILLPLAWLRWRRWIRVDESGVTLMRPRGRVIRELRWQDVDAFAQIGERGLELRGTGGRIRVEDAFEGVAGAWPWVRSNCEERILDILRERLDRGESTELRAATSRTWAHAMYLMLTAGLAGVAVFYAWAFWRSRGNLGWGALIPLVVWTALLWRCRRAASEQGGWVRVRTEGMIVKRLDARWEVDWKDVVRVAPIARKGWRLERRSGAPIHLPPDLLNLWPLARLVKERASGSDGPG